MIQICGKTDKGRVRTNNQDDFSVLPLGENAIFTVVCDGMGGERGGNVASRNAVNILVQHIRSNYHEDYDENSIRNTMLSAVSVANALVYEMALQNEALKGMGTTLVACLIKNGKAQILYAGDSRAYLISKSTIRRITRDHSVVQLLIEKGKLTEEEAQIHPKRRYITRALGVGVTLDAEYREETLESGDSILICTDGLSNLISEEELRELVCSGTPQEAVQRLIDAANDAGGFDNITAVVMTNR